MSVLSVLSVLSVTSVWFVLFVPSVPKNWLVKFCLEFNKYKCRIITDKQLSLIMFFVIIPWGICRTWQCKGFHDEVEVWHLPRKIRSCIFSRRICWNKCVRRRASQEVEGWRRRRREWRLARCTRGDEVVPTSSNQITKPVLVTRDAGSLFRPKLGHQYYISK